MSRGEAGVAGPQRRTALDWANFAVDVLCWAGPLVAIAVTLTVCSAAGWFG